MLRAKGEMGKLLKINLLFLKDKAALYTENISALLDLRILS
jgi:hypothetical protein